ncbi:FliH/SctL family protein [Desulfovibrio inopinatus]|uniref:FliH/SctL family protein n=1 Tax=Desulfovibrio inopinatus TaxID=102109 RepID=UPI0004036584|nr:FliH/SctL family protein [Desulfovibrio inopinatus]
MSLSNTTEIENSNPILASGRVILGLGSNGPEETSVGQLEGNHGPQYTDATAAEFFERVRAKATNKAKAIISQAMAEAEKIKQKAMEDGFAQGMSQAEEQAAQQIQDMADAFGQTLTELQSQRVNLWNEYHQDFITLLRLAVEKTLHLQLAEHRMDILGHLLDQSLEVIDSRTELTIKGHPDDVPALTDLLGMATQARPGLKNWRVKGDPNIHPGGVLIESGEGMVDNSIEGRWAMVEQILSQLSVDDDTPEQAPPVEHDQEPEPAPENGE